MRKVTEEMKQVIILNLINLILLLLAGFSFAALPFLVSVILFLAVLIFALYSNYVVLIQNQDDEYLLKHADRKGIFKKQVSQFIMQQESLEQREHVVQGDERLLEVYELVCKRVNNNVDSAIRFMEMYDYVQRPSIRYLEELYQENQKVMSDFNEVVEQYIKLENSVHAGDKSYMDDLIGSLKKMNN